MSFTDTVYILQTLAVCMHSLHIYTFPMHLLHIYTFYSLLYYIFLAFYTFYSYWQFVHFTVTSYLYAPTGHF